MSLVLQMQLVMMSKYSKFGVATFNTWVMGYNKVFARRRQQQQWSNDHNSSTFLRNSRAKKSMNWIKCHLHFTRSKFCYLQDKHAYRNHIWSKHHQRICSNNISKELITKRQNKSTKKLLIMPSMNQLITESLKKDSLQEQKYNNNVLRPHFMNKI